MQQEAVPANQAFSRPAAAAQEKQALPRAERRLRRRQWVNEVTGLATSSLYAAIKGRTFPEPVRIGIRSVAWYEDEVLHWVATRVPARAQQAT